MCGSDDFKPEKLAVCQRGFDGAICQRCGTILTQAEAEYCRQMEKIIDEVPVFNIDQRGDSRQGINETQGQSFACRLATDGRLFVLPARENTICMLPSP